MEETAAKKPRKRVSKRTIQRRNAAKAERAAEREQRADERAKRAAERQAKIDAENTIRWQAGYDAQLAYEAKRARERIFQNAGIEWAQGYDTPAARMFAEYVKGEEMAVKVAAHRAAMAGDPTNITGHTPEPSKKEQKRRDEAARRDKGLRFETIPDPDHPNQNVVVESFRPKPKTRLEKAHHQSGLELFWKDIEALQGVIRSPALDDLVDRSGKPSMLPSPLRARQRIEQCRVEIGRNNFNFATGYLLFNLSPNQLRKMGADQKLVRGDRIIEALDELCSFYDRSHSNRTLMMLDEIIEEGMKTILDGERLLNWPHHQKQKKKREPA